MRSALALPVLLLLVTGCEERPRPIPEPAVAPGATIAPRIVTPDGEEIDPETARLIGDALRDLERAPAEGPPEGLEAQDASALHGRWTIRHTIHRTNGEASEPSPPLAPTTWDISDDGQLRIRGGNALNLGYVYTGDRLVVTGMGPAQEYRVDGVSDTELRLTTLIEAGSLRLENTTVLDRAR
ncbi:MAG: hypothetical protein KF901_15930 [Myxococcales bacterium]|nr:hypothetical protein [Myxococcales bacterium]